VVPSAAKLLLASSFYGAMIDQFLGSQIEKHKKHLEVQETVRTILAGLKPPAAPYAHKQEKRKQNAELSLK